jgi:TolB-like protein/Flp pilus assembly protein TadD
MPLLIRRLKERKIVQWALSYAAFAWVLIEALDYFSGLFHWPASVQYIVLILLVLGFFLTLVVAWYHGEKGRQRVSGPELLIIAILLSITAMLLVFLRDETEPIAEIPETVVEAGPPSSAIARAGPSIAVLPFANLSPDAENSFFADGIHDDVLNHLSKIANLTVIARQSVVQYRGSDKTIKDISAELGVGSILEGSVRRSDGRIRVVMQLIESETEDHLWSETYDRDLDDIFQVQTDIARKVAEALEATFSPEEAERIARRPTDNLGAYDFYLMGREAYHRYNREDNQDAIRLFQKALEMDSTYARAWAGLGDAYCQGRLRYGLSFDWVDSAAAASQRAIQLDPDLAEGHKALGLCFTTSGQNRRAMESYRRALELTPNYWEAINNVAVIYSDFGLYDEAIRMHKRAFTLSPNERYHRINIAENYINLGEHEIAEVWLRAAEERDPENPYIDQIRVYLLHAKGDIAAGYTAAEALADRYPGDHAVHMTAALSAIYGRHYDRARWHIDEAGRLAPAGFLRWEKWADTILGYARLQMGDQAKADSLFQVSMGRIESDLERGLDMPSLMWENASIYAAMGNSNKALSWAEKAYIGGFRQYWLAEIDPMFDVLRNDPHFTAILDRMKRDVEAMRKRIEVEEIVAGLR